MAKRQWSREFTPGKNRKDARILNINISNVPATLRERFRVKCRVEGRSQRALLLGWIRNWVDGRQPDADPPEDGRARYKSRAEDSAAAAP